jgi:D-alanyl-D-alanine carboxypeptidase
MRRPLVWIVAALLGLALVAGGVLVAWPSGSREDGAELARLVDRLAIGEDAIAPGAAAYVSGPQGPWSHAAGVADLETGRELRPDDRFRIASITKPITALVVMQLVAEGKLALDDTVEQHLPELLPYGERITIRQLLNHTSGLWDTNDFSAAAIARVHDPALRAELETLAARVQADPTTQFPSRRWIELAAWQPLEFAPGTDYSYSNVGYEVLGEIVERVTGSTYATELERRVLDPLGLEATSFEPGPIEGEHVRLYAAEGDEWVDATDVMPGVGTEGAIVSTPEETARLYQALMRGELLPQRWLDAMKEPSPVEGAGGLGLGIDSPLGCGGTAYGHGGALLGVRGWVFVSADGSRVATLFLNGRGPDTDRRGIPTANDLYCATEG